MYYWTKTITSMNVNKLLRKGTVPRELPLSGVWRKCLCWKVLECHRSAWQPACYQGVCLLCLCKQPHWNHCDTHLGRGARNDIAAEPGNSAVKERLSTWLFLSNYLEQMLPDPVDVTHTICRSIRIFVALMPRLKLRVHSAALSKPCTSNR